MKHETARKLRQLVLPGVALSVLALALCSALNWFVLSGTERLTEEMVDYGLPLFIATLLEAAIILPRLRRLEMGQNNFPLLYNCAAIALLAAPAMLAQLHIRDARAEMVHVSDASGIAKAAPAKFYTAGTICANVSKVRMAKPVITPRRDGNQILDVAFYVVVPVCIPAVYQSTNPNVLPDEKQTMPSPAVNPAATGVWIGLKFAKGIDNRGDRAAFKKAFEQFARESDLVLARLDPAKYRYWERSGRDRDRRYFDKALAGGGTAVPPGQTVLIPHTGPLPSPDTRWLMWSLLALVGGAAVWSALVLLTPTRIETGFPVKNATLVDAAIPTVRSYGLPLLVDVNVAVFLVMAFMGLGFLAFDVEDLIAWGGRYGPALMQGEAYRLITSQFVHGGIMHLASNIYGLVVAGVLLAPVLSNWRLILAYLVTGLGGATASFVLHPRIVGAGASGAILGLWGVLTVLDLARDPRIGEQRAVILSNGATYVGLTMMMGSYGPGIDTAAHVGGFVTGLVVGGAIVLLGRHQRARDFA